jgi:hypothetical protein
MVCGTAGCREAPTESLAAPCQPVNRLGYSLVKFVYATFDRNLRWPSRCKVGLCFSGAFFCFLARLILLIDPGRWF